MYGVVALLIYMPFHVFVSQWLSLYTGGLEVWKGAKDVLLAALVLFAICLVWQQRLWDRTMTILVGAGAGYLGLHLLVWLCNPGIYAQTAVLGTVYNVRLLAFVVLAYGAIILWKKQNNKFTKRSLFGICSLLLKVVTGVSSVVALLGVVQFFLPADFLTHFGYSLDRGARPAFFIDDNPAFPRIMSTLREPNALGAYLILPIAALTALLLRARNTHRRTLLLGMLLIHGAALFLTSSRSAWLGTALAVSLVVWWLNSSVFVRLLQRWWPLVVVAIACLLLVGVAIRDSQFVRTNVTHSTPEVVQDLDSNDYHWLLTRRGLEEVADQPLGHGPGTAGIVSIQNPNGAFLTENYYVQIAYEVGVIGLAVFVALSVVLYLRIYRRHDYVSAILLASFWAYLVTNMLLHTWSNEAVAAQWWLLAGLSLALVVGDGKKPDDSKTS